MSTVVDLGILAFFPTINNYWLAIFGVPVGGIAIRMSVGIPIRRSIRRSISMSVSVSVGLKRRFRFFVHSAHRRLFAISNCVGALCGRGCEGHFYSPNRGLCALTGFWRSRSFVTQAIRLSVENRSTKMVSAGSCSCLDSRW